MPCWDDVKHSVDFDPPLNKSAKREFTRILQLYTAEKVDQVTAELRLRRSRLEDQAAV